MVDAPQFEKPAQRVSPQSLWGTLRSAYRSLLPTLPRRVAVWTAAEWSRDSARLALWTPVAIGAGAAVYFSLKVEPTALLSTALFFTTALVALRWRKPFLLGCFLFALGFVAGDLRTAIVTAPKLDRDLSIREITGRLISVEEGQKRRRLVIEVASIARLAPEETPKRLRVTWRGADFDARAGDMLSIRAALSPPPPPVAPGAYNFARQLYFDRIGAVGFAVTPPVVDQNAAKPFASRLRAIIEGVRVQLARRILETAPGQGGAIVAAVVTGKRAAINEASTAALRDSGLAHLLAISGLHMGLATGLIFFATRAGLALSERLALEYPIKKWAAGAALVSGFCYLLLSGGGWSARRAFIMTSIIFIAIIVDRRALSLRNVAIAACVILLLTPEAVLHPGFQMSFAAVTALIAAYEWASSRPVQGLHYSFIARLRRYAVGIGVTDTIAAVATAPFGLYHFHRAAIYSLPANLAAMPLMAFWIMPSAIVALCLTPLGFDEPFWRLAAMGVDVVLFVSTWVSSRPGAVTTLSHWPPIALTVIVFGGLWFCLMLSRLRFLGLVALPVAAAFISVTPAPDIFINREGDNAAIVLYTEENERVIAVFHPRKSRFAVRAWTEFVGLDSEKKRPRAMAELAPCDGNGCVVFIKGRTISFLSERMALHEDCAKADFVIALFSVSRRDAASCPAQLINYWSVRDKGAHSITIGTSDAKIRTLESAIGQRPWR